MKYYISDYHFFRETMTSDGEKPMPIYMARNFKSCYEMNDYIIDKWNSKVTNEDTVFYIGDFSNGTKEQTIEVLKKLKGHKNLILGNYDSYIKEDKELSSFFDNIDYYMETIDGNSKIVMCHYPLLWYDKSKNDDYMFHGHIHDVSTDLEIMKDIEEMMRTKSLGAHFGGSFINTYCEFSDYVPLSKEEWLLNDKYQKEKIK